jgi:hypothetical protein
MTHSSQMAQWQEELVDACRYGEEVRARELISQLAAQPRKARALLERMLTDPDALVRQAAAFGLGELGGAASARRLEQQLALEEARGDYDGESVVEAIVQAMGRLEEASARATLVRRLERLVAGKPTRGDVSTIARALWRKRHPELLPAVQRSLERLGPPTSRPLVGLQVLLEKSPAELLEWARDPAVPVQHKTGVVALLDEELPDALVSTLPAFISAAHALVETAVSQDGEASNYCDRLFILLLLYPERALLSLPPEARAQVRDLALRLLAGVCPNCSLRAASVLEHVGLPEDAARIEAHRPAEPALAEVFDAAALALRQN